MRIIIVESCLDCTLRLGKKIELDCPTALWQREKLPDSIHSRCKLPNYRQPSLKTTVDGQHDSFKLTSNQ